MTYYIQTTKYEFRVLSADNSTSEAKKQLNPGVNKADFVLGLLYLMAGVKFLLFIKKKGQNFFDN